MSPLEIKLRPAVWDDCTAVWTWNNAEDVRALSMDAKPIPLASHKLWYRARLDDARHWMWIAHVDNSDVGIVRIDGVAGDDRDGIGVVSIALQSTARGQGIGRHVLAQACSAFFRERPDGVLHACIAFGNDASTRCFAHCGFNLLRSRRHAGRTFLTYSKAGKTR